jgi:hypothetical protein
MKRRRTNYKFASFILFERSKILGHWSDWKLWSVAAEPHPVCQLWIPSGITPKAWERGVMLAGKRTRKFGRS